MGDIGILVVHGMGTQKADFDDEFKAKLTKELGASMNRIAWEKVHWAPVVAGAETDMWKRVSQDGDLDWRRVRQFFMNYFADALAYQRAGYRRQVDTDPSATYERIQDCVRDALVRLRKQLGGDKPVVVVAHSLGAYIMTSYVYDRQHWNRAKEGDVDDPRGTTLFTRMETLAGLVTHGANLPLFAFATTKPKTIDFPGVALPPPIAARAAWLNFYDPDDVLGWPLKHVYDEPASTIARIVDTPVNVGGLLTSWNPMAHTAYWTDKDFVQPVAQFLESLLP